MSRLPLALAALALAGLASAAEPDLAGRVEVSVLGGGLPSNPYAKRPFAGALVDVHLTGHFALELAGAWSPDRGEADLKPLASTLVQIAHTGTSSARFQIPVDKESLAAGLALRWTPLLGDLEVFGLPPVGGAVYLVGGLGVLELRHSYAGYDPEGAAAGDVVNLTMADRELKLTGALGAGAELFVHPSVSLRVDVRTLPYVGRAPTYDPDGPEGGVRMSLPVISSGGVSVLFPWRD